MKVFLLSLGCAKNQVDSERIAGLLEGTGYELVEEASEADVGLVNTCAFIRPAVEESIEAILELENLKKTGRLKRIGVLGCLFNRYGTELVKELPSVDIWARCEEWQAVLEGLGHSSLPLPQRRLLPGAYPWTRYLKIAEGCDHRCAYCTIPSIRGPLRSLPFDELVRETHALVEEGGREICLVAQDLTAFGLDRSGKSELPQLLDLLDSSLPEGVWLRLLYLHPSRIDEALLEHLASLKHVLHYLDVPIQHADERILAAMNRPLSRDRLKRIFETARRIDPDFALRTTCLVGFPGEDEAAFSNLLSFVEEIVFDRLGAFPFYPEEKTPAFSMTSQVPEKVKRARVERLMRLQAELSLSRQQRFIGRTLEVLVEDVFEDGTASSRSYREAPEVDGEVLFSSLGSVIPGQKAFVRVTEALEHDLIAEAQSGV